MIKILRDTPRDIKFIPNINPYATGSVLASFGNTQVHVTAVIEESVPPFLKGKGKGWLTAEYNMLPSSTHTRTQRERSKVGGRTQEIQRLIGRSLRACLDLNKLGERTLLIDCDVMVADGGTRTTSISGAYVAVSLAVKKLLDQGLLKTSPIITQIGAVSIGVNSEGQIIADLNYEEDSSCETDMNVVMTRQGHFIEIQGTAEKKPFSEEQLGVMLRIARKSLDTIFEKQDAIIQ
ncbi:MAG: ribonuclease PH [Bdellovibrio sp.]|nr:ribonuclease PH [Bdellovibrio sp.]